MCVVTFVETLNLEFFFSRYQILCDHFFKKENADKNIQNSCYRSDSILHKKNKNTRKCIVIYE